MLSVLVHGSGIALFLRRNEPSRRAPKTAVKSEDKVGVQADVKPAALKQRSLPVAAGVADAAAAEPDSVAEKTSINELRHMWESGEPVIVVDARADRSYQADPRQVAGAVRIQPEDPVRSAEMLRLSQHATLVVYCA